MQIKRNLKGGFTLIELIVVIAILGILAAIAVPSISGYLDKAKYAADIQNLQQLNKATDLYEITGPSPNAFNVISNSDNILMQTLITEGLLQAIPIAKQRDVSFVWDFSRDEWQLSFSTVITASNVTFNKTGGQKGYIFSYTGTTSNITLAAAIDGVAVTHIYQDAFNGKKLTSVIFANDSSITTIHARAFSNNNLTELTLPNTLQKLDYGSFSGNSITKVTIGANVSFEANVINGNDTFKTAYLANGAGSYVYVNKTWVKQ